MGTNRHIPDLVKQFSYVRNGGLNLVFKLAKPITCMTVVSNVPSIRLLFYNEIYCIHLPTYIGDELAGTLSSSRATPTIYNVVPPTPCKACPNKNTYK